MERCLPKSSMELQASSHRIHSSPAFRLSSIVNFGFSLYQMFLSWLLLLIFIRRLTMLDWLTFFVISLGEILKLSLSSEKIFKRFQSGLGIKSRG